MGASARALVVEDSSAVRRILCRVLMAHGYQVVAASSAEEAIGYLEQEEFQLHEFQLLMTDYQLPGKTGVELIRSLKKPAKLRVILMSADTSKLRKEDLHGLCIHAVLQKPFQLDQLTPLLT